MKVIALILLGTFLFGCHKSASNEVTKIELAKGTCLGPCIPTAISLDDSLNYKFYADSSTTWNKIKPKKIIAKYKGIVSKRLWSDLMETLDSIDYKHLDTSRITEIADAQQIELIIYFDHHQIKITHTDSKTEKVINLLDGISDKIKLSPTDDTLNFDTKLQLQYQNWLLGINKKM